MDNKTQQQSLLDVRKMRRALKLRSETDPEMVYKTLETILKEAVVLNASGEKTFANSSLKELKQVRRSILAGQINAGGGSGDILIKLSATIDHIDKINSEIGREGSEFNLDARGALSSLTDNLPSADTIISAVMTANPIFGYGLNMIKNINSSRKRRIQFEKDERSRRMNLLKEQEEEEIRKQHELDNPTADPVNETNLYLQAIRDEIKSLRSEMTHEELLECDKSCSHDSTNDDLYNRQSPLDLPLSEEKYFLPLSSANDDVEDQPKNVERLSNNEAGYLGYQFDNLAPANDVDDFLPEPVVTGDGEETVKNLERVNGYLYNLGETFAAANDNLERITDIESDRLEMERAKQQTEGFRESESKLEGLGDLHQDKLINNKKEKGDIGLMALFGALRGGVLGTAIMSMLAPITGLLSGVMALAKGAGKLIKRLGPVMFLVKSVYDFVDGFFDASKYVEGRIPELHERIASGLAGLIDGVVDLPRWISEKVSDGLGYAADNVESEIGKKVLNSMSDFFGSLFGDSDSLKDTVFWFFSDFKENALGFLEWWFIGLPTEMLNDVSTWIETKLIQAVDGFKTWIDDKLDFLPDLSIDGNLKKLNDKANEVGEKLFSGIDILADKIANVDIVKEMSGAMVDMAMSPMNPFNGVLSQSTQGYMTNGSLTGADMDTRYGMSVQALEPAVPSINEKIIERMENVQRESNANAANTKQGNTVIAPVSNNNQTNSYNYTSNGSSSSNMEATQRRFMNNNRAG